MRIRSAKILGTRYDLNYFKRHTAFKRWRLGISIFLIAFAVGGLGGSYAMHKRSIYSPGPLSPAHALIANKCESCHEPGKGFRHTVTDEACQQCHQAPEHHTGGDKELSASADHSCASCHVEHQGREQLVKIRDGMCVQCHSNLQEKGIQKGHHTDIANDIEAFNIKQHPEFKTAFQPVPTTIRFPHKAHLEKRLLYPTPYPGEEASPNAVLAPLLTCRNCHRLAAESAVGKWEYAGEDLRVAANPVPARTLHPDSGREFMLIPNYEQQCVRCHELKIDRLLNNNSDQLEHPRQLRKDLRSFLKDQFVAHQKELGANVCGIKESPVLPEEVRRSRVQDNVDAWATQCAAGMERLIEKKCEYCHQFKERRTDPPPVVTESALKSPEMQHSVFSHQAHLTLKCEECHTKARATDESATSLLPLMETCSKCHTGSPAKAGRADNGCFMCHRYHDWPHQPGKPGEFTIQQLTE